MIKDFQVEVLTNEVLGMLKLLEDLPMSAVPALLEAADEGSQIIIAKAQRERFRGKGPFAVSKRQLGVVTGRLRKSLTASKPRVTSQAQVAIRIGSNVKYFGAHEFGHNASVRVKAHSRRTKSGGTSTVQAHSRRMKMPKRAPLAAALEQHSGRVFGATFAEKFGQLLEAS